MPCLACKNDDCLCGIFCCCDKVCSCSSCLSSLSQPCQLCGRAINHEILAESNNANDYCSCFVNAFPSSKSSSPTTAALEENVITTTQPVKFIPQALAYNNNQHETISHTDKAANIQLIESQKIIFNPQRESSQVSLSRDNKPVDLSESVLELNNMQVNDQAALPVNGNAQVMLSQNSLAKNSNIQANGFHTTKKCYSSKLEHIPNSNIVHDSLQEILCQRKTTNEKGNSVHILNGNKFLNPSLPTFKSNERNMQTKQTNDKNLQNINCTDLKNSNSKPIIAHSGRTDKNNGHPVLFRTDSLACNNLEKLSGMRVVNNSLLENVSHLSQAVQKNNNNLQKTSTRDSKNIIQADSTRHNQSLLQETSTCNRQNLQKGGTNSNQNQQTNSNGSNQSIPERASTSNNPNFIQTAAIHQGNTTQIASKCKNHRQSNLHPIKSPNSRNDTQPNVPPGLTVLSNSKQTYIPNFPEASNINQASLQTISPNSIGTNILQSEVCNNERISSIPRHSVACNSRKIHTNFTLNGVECNNLSDQTPINEEHNSRIQSFPTTNLLRSNLQANHPPVQSDQLTNSCEKSGYLPQVMLSNNHNLHDRNFLHFVPTQISQPYIPYTLFGASMFHQANNFPRNIQTCLSPQTNYETIPLCKHLQQTQILQQQMATHNEEVSKTDTVPTSDIHQDSLESVNNFNAPPFLTNLSVRCENVPNKTVSHAENVNVTKEPSSSHRASMFDYNDPVNISLNTANASNQLPGSFQKFNNGDRPQKDLQTHPSITDNQQINNIETSTEEKTVLGHTHVPQTSTIQNDIHSNPPIHENGNRCEHFHVNPHFPFNYCHPFVQRYLIPMPELQQRMANNLVPFAIGSLAFFPQHILPDQLGPCDPTTSEQRCVDGNEVKLVADSRMNFPEVNNSIPTEENAGLESAPHSSATSTDEYITCTSEEDVVSENEECLKNKLDSLNSMDKIDTITSLSDDSSVKIASSLVSNLNPCAKPFNNLASSTKVEKQVSSKSPSKNSVNTPKEFPEKAATSLNENKNSIFEAAEIIYCNSHKEIKDGIVSTPNTRIKVMTILNDSNATDHQSSSVLSKSNKSLDEKETNEISILPSEHLKSNLSTNSENVNALLEHSTQTTSNSVSISLPSTATVSPVSSFSDDERPAYRTSDLTDLISKKYMINDSVPSFSGRNGYEPASESREKRILIEQQEGKVKTTLRSTTETKKVETTSYAAALKRQRAAKKYW